MTKEEIMTALNSVKMDISICISDIDPKHMVKSANGKVYCNLTVAKRMNPDQWKRDVKVYQTQTRAEIDAHETLQYVGAGRVFIFEEKPLEHPTEEDITKILTQAQAAPPKQESAPEKPQQLTDPEPEMPF